MDPSLYKAATRGDVATLKRLLEVDPSILDSKTPQLNTALHLAALHGHTDFVREVLDVKEELLVAKNDDGDSPLHLAARYGERGVVELFARRARSWPPEDPTTAAGGSPSLRNPLMMANKAGDTPLHDAVRNRRGAVALLLLDANPDRGNDLNGLGESPLEMAAGEGLFLVAERIVNHPWAQQVSPVNQVRGNNALHQAVLGRHIRILGILLEKRPELIDLTDSNGNNALHYAAKKNHARAVEMLLNKRMNLAYTSNHEQQSPLHVAARYGSTDAIAALLRCCPDAVEMVDNDGRNAFHASVVSGKVNALRCLLRRVGGGAKEQLNRVDKKGDTPLHLAASMSRPNSALLLLSDRRVDPCVVNRDGQTARSLLELRGEIDASEMYVWTQLTRHESMRCRNLQPTPPLQRPKSSASAQRGLQEFIGIQVIIASLVATVTFAATVTMPGGYSQTEGTAIHSHRAAFKIFLVSNTIAMSSSSAVLLCFLYPVKHYKVNPLLWGHRLTFLACLAMIVSFVTAVYVTVAPTVRWPVHATIAIGASIPVLVALILGRDAIFIPL